MTNALERYDEIDKASQLWLKGYSFAQMAKTMDITVLKAKSLIEDYKSFVIRQTEEDPEFLNKIEENTIKALDEMSMISKEAWETYEDAKQGQMTNMMIQSLKLAKDIAESKAKLKNLLGVKADSGNMIQMRKLERVNEIVSSIIKEIVADCPKCRVEAQVRLAEAFSLMDRADEAAEMHELTEGDIVDAIIVEDDFDHEGMHANIVGEK